MRNRILFLALAASLSGCIIHTTTPPPPPSLEPGDVDVAWSFADGSDCNSAGVDHIQVSIPGEQLENGGDVPCSAAGAQAVAFTDFEGGDYTITVTALDINDQPIYQGTSSFTVNGDVTVQVDLQPLSTGPQPGNITVNWTFADGDNCAGVDHVEIDIPGEFSQSFPCSDQGENLTNFQPATYQVTVTAFDVDGNALYQGTGDATVDGNTTVNIVLQPTAQPGNVTVTWTFQNGGTCSSNGIDHVQITIPGAGTLQNGGVYPCQAGDGTQAVLLSNFEPGTYTVTVDADSPGGTPFETGSAPFTVNGDTTVPVVLQ